MTLHWHKPQQGGSCLAAEEDPGAARCEAGKASPSSGARDARAPGPMRPSGSEFCAVRWPGDTEKKKRTEANRNRAGRGGMSFLCCLGEQKIDMNSWIFEVSFSGGTCVRMVQEWWYCVELCVCVFFFYWFFQYECCLVLLDYVCTACVEWSLWSGRMACMKQLEDVQKMRVLILHIFFGSPVRSCVHIWIFLRHVCSTKTLTKQSRLGEMLVKSLCPVNCSFILDRGFPCSFWVVRFCW